MSRRPRPRGAAAGSPKRRVATESAAIDVIIDSLGARGDGLARLGDAPLYVAGALPGERVSVRPGARRGDGRVGRLEAVLEASADRVAPPCPLAHPGGCGGCTLQHLAPAAVQTEKRRLVATALTRAGLDPALVAAPLAVPPGRRQRASLSGKRIGKGVVLGFQAAASHDVIAVGHCPALHPDLDRLLGPLAELLAGLTTFRAGGVRLQRANPGPEVLIDLAAPPDLKARQELAAFAETQRLGRLAVNSPEGLEPVADHAPWIELGGVPVGLPPGSFLQPSAEGAALLGGLAVAALAPLDGRLADLFAGLGTLTLPLAAAGRAVHAVEAEAAPLKALAGAAGRAGLAVTTEARDLFRRPLAGAELAGLAGLVFDPPRAGALAQAEALAEAARRPLRLLAVSCNPATLARDLARLVDGGHRVRTVLPIDQFPWTAHVEAMAIVDQAPGLPLPDLERFRN
ncbi:class I SAM-dependent RNA methyltransferase [Roseospirillum parvum]|uniref:23S rRNA (Uracil1939-C5)-methyltransferase n=1 Tax=Roseospirillum parvum TaxID=83401 RepID=A0A1G7ZP05_9PROT|nr:class I SAM-dependent RNA methyltransferase [Roseospirillum parvum]SDH10453.1 23S rRNA (uracil1939-C5)-methyltransferase [Roseospirillum parvum]